MTATVLAPYLKQRFVDANGAPLYLGTVNTYAAGTNTPIVTYKDSTGISTNTNPITLNPRGECDIWLLPNVAYKFQVNDALGNLIWTEDNVINSQLITLYGGVDTGGVNAYVLTFAASFTAYVDGIVIIWIPANTNAGSSTINVNGLGVVNIVNPDGSALGPNEIVASQPAQILFKAGAFQLITPATTASKSATIAWTGAALSTTITYRKTGNLAAITFPVGTALSTSTSLSLSGLPAAITSTVLSQNVPCLGMTDNGVALATASMAIVAANGTITFYKDPSQTLWTNGGQKGFNGAAGGGVTIVYPL
jgi:hypothetical protein